MPKTGSEKSEDGGKIGEDIASGNENIEDKNKNMIESVQRKRTIRAVLIPLWKKTVVAGFLTMMREKQKLRLRMKLKIRMKKK